MIWCSNPYILALSYSSIQNKIYKFEDSWPLAKFCLYFSSWSSFHNLLLMSVSIWLSSFLSYFPIIRKDHDQNKVSVHFRVFYWHKYYKFFLFINFQIMSRKDDKFWKEYLRITNNKSNVAIKLLIYANVTLTFFLWETGKTWVCLPTLSCFGLFQPCWCCQYFAEQQPGHENGGKCFHTKDECNANCHG